MSDYRRLLAFKYLFCDIVGDPRFRQRLSGFHDLAFVELQGRSVNWVVGNAGSLRGTLYIGLGDDAHFMSYRNEGDRVVIFDPSHPDGTYSHVVRRRMSCVRNVFPGKRIEFDETYPCPQVLEEDTFCQTWSLAYFLRYREILSGSGTSKFKLYTLIREIVNSRPFQNIIRNNWSQFVEWQSVAMDMDLVPAGSVCFIAPSNFVDYVNEMSPFKFGLLLSSQGS